MGRFVRWLEGKGEDVIDTITSTPEAIINTVTDPQRLVNFASDVFSPIPGVGPTIAPATSVIDYVLDDGKVTSQGLANAGLAGMVNGTPLARWKPAAAPVMPTSLRDLDADVNDYVLRAATNAAVGFDAGINIASIGWNQLWGGDGFNPELSAQGFNRQNILMIGGGLINAGMSVWEGPLKANQELQAIAATEKALGVPQSNFIGASSPLNFAEAYLAENPEEAQRALAVYQNGFDSNNDGVADYRGGRAIWEYIIGKQPWTTRLAAEVLNDPINWISLGFGTGANLLTRAGLSPSAGGKVLQIAGKTYNIVDEVSGVLRPMTHGDVYLIAGRTLEQAGRVFDIATDPLFSGLPRIINNSPKIYGNPNTLGSYVGRGVNAGLDSAARGIVARDTTGQAWWSEPAARRLEATNFSTRAADTADAGMLATTTSGDFTVAPATLLPWEKPVAPSGMWQVITPRKNGDSYIVDMFGRPIGVRETGKDAAGRLAPEARRLNERAAGSKNLTYDEWLTQAPTRIQDRRALATRLLFGDTFQQTAGAQATPIKFTQQIEEIWQNAPLMRRPTDAGGRDRVNAWYDAIGAVVQRDANGRVTDIAAKPGSLLDNFLNQWVELDYRWFDTDLDGGMVAKVMQQQALLNATLGQMMAAERSIVGSGVTYQFNPTVQHYKDKYGVDIPLDANGLPQVEGVIGLWMRASTPLPNEERILVPNPNGAGEITLRKKRELDLFALTEDLSNRISWGSKEDAAKAIRAMAGRFRNGRAVDRYGNEWFRKAIDQLTAAARIARTANTPLPNVPTPPNAAARQVDLDRNGNPLPNTPDPAQSLRDDANAIGLWQDIDREPPVPAGKYRVYSSGNSPAVTGPTERWVATDREYASGYRPDLDLWYIDLDINDPRLYSPGSLDQYEQDIASGDLGARKRIGNTFQLTVEESAAMQPTNRASLPPGPIAASGYISFPRGVSEPSGGWVPEVDGFDRGRRRRWVELGGNPAVNNFEPVLTPQSLVNGDVEHGTIDGMQLWRNPQTQQWVVWDVARDQPASNPMTFQQAERARLNMSSQPLPATQTSTATPLPLAPKPSARSSAQPAPDVPFVSFNGAEYLKSQSGAVRGSLALFKRRGAAEFVVVDTNTGEVLRGPIAGLKNANEALRTVEADNAMASRQSALGLFGSRAQQRADMAMRADDLGGVDPAGSRVLRPGDLGGVTRGPQVLRPGAVGGRGVVDPQSLRADGLLMDAGLSAMPEPVEPPVPSVQPQAAPTSPTPEPVVEPPVANATSRRGKDTEGRRNIQTLVSEDQKTPEVVALLNQRDAAEIETDRLEAEYLKAKRESRGGYSQTKAAAEDRARAAWRDAQKTESEINRQIYIAIYENTGGSRAIEPATTSTPLLNVAQPATGLKPGQSWRDSEKTNVTFPGERGYSYSSSNQRILTGSDRVEYGAILREVVNEDGRVVERWYKKDPSTPGVWRRVDDKGRAVDNSRSYMAIDENGNVVAKNVSSDKANRALVKELEPGDDYSSGGRDYKVLDYRPDGIQASAARYKLFETGDGTFTVSEMVVWNNRGGFRFVPRAVGLTQDEALAYVRTLQNPVIAPGNSPQLGERFSTTPAGYSGTKYDYDSADPLSDRWYFRIKNYGTVEMDIAPAGRPNEIVVSGGYDFRAMESMPNASFKTVEEALAEIDRRIYLTGTNFELSLRGETNFYSGIGPTPQQMDQAVAWAAGKARQGAARAGESLRPVLSQAAGVSPSVVPPGRTPGMSGFPGALEKMRANGELSREQVELLTMAMPGDPNGKMVIETWADLVGGGSSNDAAWATIAGQIRDWGRMNRADRAAMIANGGVAVQRQLNKLQRLDQWVNRYLIEMPRQQMMYNPLTGYKGALQDLVGNTTHNLINGQYQAAVDMFTGAGPERLWWMIKNPGTVQEAFTQQTDSVLRAAGISLPSEVMNPRLQSKIDVEEDELVLHQLLKKRRIGKTVGNVIQSKRALEMRNATDLLSRGTTMISAYTSGHPAAVQRFRALLRKNGIDDDAFMREIMQTAQVRTGDPGVVTFAVRDIHAVTKGMKMSPELKQGLARAWREEQQGLINAGRKAVGDAFFVGKRSGNVSAMSRAFYFHFWLTQSTAMHVRKMIESPRVLRAYVNLWNGVEEEAEKNGYPPTLTGMVQWFKGESGMAALWNPLLLVVPSFIFDSAIIGDEEGGFIETISTMMPFTPILGGALAALGKSDKVPDFLGTRGNWEKVAQTVLTWAASKGLDLTGGGAKPEPQIIEEATAKGIEALNAVAQWFGADDVNLYMSSEGRSDNYTAILNEEAIRQWGPMDTWTPEEWDEYSQAYQSIKTGSRATPLAERVQDIYANWQFGVTAANLVVPGGVMMRYGPRDEARRLGDLGVRSAGTQRDLQRATGSAGGLIIERETAKSGARVAIGDADMRWVNGYNDIRDGFPDTTQFRPDDWVVIGGQKVTVSAIRAMPEDQRQQLADQFLNERGARAIYEDYETLRKTAEKSLPGGQANDWRSFQQMVYNYNGGPRGFRTAARTTSPNWARAEADFRRYQEGQGKKGAVLEEELDSWAVSQASYLAYIGQQESVYDADPLATNGGSMLMGFNQGRDTGTPRSTADVVRNEIRDGQIRNELSQWGIFGPLAGINVSPGPMGSTAQMYMNWAASRPGMDNSPEIFGAWLAQNGGGQPLDRLPSYFREYAPQ